MNSGLQNLRVCNLQGGQFSDSNTQEHYWRKVHHQITTITAGIGSLF